MEKHIFVVSELAFQYFWLFKTGSGSNSKTFFFFDQSNVDLSIFTVMGSDGTALNTGHIGDKGSHSLNGVAFVKTVALVCLPASCK